MDVVNNETTLFRKIIIIAVPILVLALLFYAIYKYQDYFHKTGSEKLSEAEKARIISQLSIPPKNETALSDKEKKEIIDSLKKLPSQETSISAEEKASILNSLSVPR